jgi:hypothetical protein
MGYASVHGKSLGLFGRCVTCRAKVARVLEGAPVREDLQPGDRVIWWKRIPGGDYVYPVRASVTNTGPYPTQSLITVLVYPSAIL